MESTAWAERPHVAAKREGGVQGEEGGEREVWWFDIQYGGGGITGGRFKKKEGISVQLQVESEKKGREWTRHPAVWDEDDKWSCRRGVGRSWLL